VAIAPRAPGAGPRARGSVARLWTVDADTLVALPVKTGLTDGTRTEVSGAGLTDGTKIVLGTNDGSAAATAASPASSPFQPATQQRGGRGPAGPF
jgi:HlyD family secretion protein